MKKRVLKVVAVLAVALMAVWNAGLNETKILFGNLFNLESMAKMETICLGEGSRNTGTCKKNIPEDGGSSCVKPGYWDSENCFSTAAYEFPD